MFIGGSPTFLGGLGIFGKNNNGDEFSYTLTDDSTIPPLSISNGEWTFWAIGWTSATNLEGPTKCGMQTATLDGGDLGVSMTLSQANCANTDFADAAFINTDQFHPVVISSCYTQTIVDDTTTCDGGFKGGHRSFRFIMDTKSNFGGISSATPIISDCFDEASATSGSSTTTITIPAGGIADIPLNVTIEGYSSTGCTGNLEEFDLPNGFAGTDSTVEAFAGASQTKVYIDDLTGPADIVPPVDPTTISFTGSNPTNNITPGISLSSLEVGANIEFYSDVTCTASISGPFAISTGTEIFNLTALTDGVHSVYTDVTDAALNTSNCTSVGSITIDSVVPTATSVTIASNNTDATLARAGDIVTLSFTVSEVLAANPVVTISGNAATIGGSFPNYTASYTFGGADTEGVIPYTIDFSDSATNAASQITATTNASQVIFDKTAPTLTSVSIYSDNSNTALARVGDTVSIDFTVSETVSGSATVLIDGNAASVIGSHPNYTASYTMNGGDTEGVTTFTIDFTDSSGNAGTQVTAVTDASTVSFDETMPSAGSIGIFSDNTNPAMAKVGDSVSVSITVSEPLNADPVVTIAGNAASVIGSYPNYTASYVMSGGEGEGFLTFIVDFSDAAGNPTSSITAVTDASSVNFDETLPTIALTTPADNSYINSSNDSASFNVSGTCSETENVTIVIDGGDVTSGSCDGTNFSILVDTTGLVEGARTFTARISDAAGNETTATIFNITKDVTAPTISSFFVDDTVRYYESDIIDIDVTFSENVNDGSSMIDLSTGGSALYSFGNGTNTLTYQYTVTEGDSDSDVDYNSTTPFSGTVADLAGNYATLTVATPGTVGSIADAYEVMALGHGKALIGTAGAEANTKIAVDSLLGDVYMVMNTTGSIADTNGGGSDVYISRSRPDGTLIEEIQFGTSCASLIGGCNASGTETVKDLYFDDSTGFLYVVGETNSNSFLPTSIGTGTGVHAWMMEISFDPSYVSPPTVSRGAIYRYPGNQTVTGMDFDGISKFAVVGVTSGDLSGSGCTSSGGVSGEPFILSLTVSNFHTTITDCATFGSNGNDYATDVKFDASGKAIVVGESDSTTGNSYFTETTTLGGGDIYVWQFTLPTISIPDAQYRLNTANTDAYETPSSLTIDGTDLYITGKTTGSPYTANAGGDDYLILHLNDSLVFQLGFQAGSTGDDVLIDSVVNSIGEVYAVGSTTGAVTGTNTAGIDTFVHGFGTGLITNLGAVQYDNAFGVYSDPSINTNPGNLVLLDDDALIISMLVDGDLFGTGSFGSTDGAMLLIKAP